jgi:hypothetical protein
MNSPGIRQKSRTGPPTLCAKIKVMKILDLGFPLLLLSLVVLLTSACETAPNSMTNASNERDPASIEQRCPAGGEACLKAFDSTLSRIEPVTRFDRRIQYLEDQVIGKTKSDEILDALNVELVRKNLLQFQGLLKIYESIPASKQDLKIVSVGRKDLKTLEDAIGHLQRTEDVLTRSREGGADSHILQFLEADLKAARTQAIKDLEKAGWLPNPIQHLKELRETLGQYDFKKKSKDQKLQVEALRNLAKEYRKDIREMEPFFFSKRYSHEDLESGPHAARRALRWILTIIQASDGMYYHESPPGKEAFIAELEPTFGKKKYLELLPPTKGALPISRYDALILNKFIIGLGDLKDFKESQLDLRDALVRHNLVMSREQAEQIAFDVMKKKFGDVDVEAKARSLYKEYRAIDPLKNLMSVLEADLKSAD